MLSIVSHPACRDFDPGPPYPDVPQRLDVIQNQLIASGLDFVLRHYDAPEATREQLIRAHDPAYVDQIFRLAPAEGAVQIDDDTVMTPEALPAALRSAGAAIMAVDLVMAGQASQAFCPVRPPGHHAECAAAMGFCFFNNVAVAARHALEAHGLSRVAIADFDAHHSNGTEDIFRDDPRVLFCSTFQHPFYPNTGRAEDTDTLACVPLRDGDGSIEFRAAVEAHWLPALRRFRPELLLISAGFDGHQADAMSGLNLIDRDFAWVTRELKDVADGFAGGRLVSVLEGGYELSVLGRSVVSHLKALME